MDSGMENLVLYILMKYFIMLHHYLWCSESGNLLIELHGWSTRKIAGFDFANGEYEWQERQVKLAPFNKLNIFYRLKNQFYSTIYSNSSCANFSSAICFHYNICYQSIYFPIIFFSIRISISYHFNNRRWFGLFFDCNSHSTDYVGSFLFTSSGSSTTKNSVFPN